ncbi:MAG: LytTR family DNA-binding domain-containing protein [Paenibacillus macerans]|uniref:DNA-binding response regulator n=1 Tax=Paenibacillus macerans TaxID=44252 RepID=A0A090Y9B0_PAEMA|nr:LytTR family DNA-binding domain-containing protein [Paenibacillus macerans]KFM94412.1 lytTr DNA-binding domain protein [Paenibacillus macerans]MBS5909589.1 LytTR family transcriptional regulator DNA-binding domain-containing protein [Paenibacillus macerans]MCY7557253.1 LytTR family DNA-binding domain-containing protein [Paenibacillus macerans]MDU7471822.1 LytTR family DNA-binding domain-containing protein [Paenibacillus macerans]MEC0136843.1 LytTR family DNA-binding domain-containing protei
MIKIAICLDSPKLLKEIHGYMQHYCTLNDTHLDVRKYYNFRGFLRDIYYQAFDLVFMDLPKSGEQEFAIVEKVKKIVPDAVIAFVSISSASIIVKEPNLANVVFITKPINYGKIEFLVNEIRNVKSYRERKSLLVKNDQGIFKIRCCDIIFLERCQKSVIIHTNTEEINSCRTMKEYESKLREPVFFRCHTSFIVNTNYIANLHDHELSMINKKVIPVSRYRRKGLIQLMLSPSRCEPMNPGAGSTFSKQV